MFNSSHLFSVRVSTVRVSTGQEFGQWGRAPDLSVLQNVWDLSWKTQKPRADSPSKAYSVTGLQADVSTVR